ncbi:dihydrolipoyl dehydrogenase [Deinococcus peraridilitoris]|uniref:Dihydrolipoyl dehydrogenase n=1 Tax=Deinococcus peraridilitoris (strain DSM 19664 / LMG 22246 / CIP 109416 / KR-200) TaxID=937777 RepID=L0A794_DEIPD|nr:dihydrolipoyl dehydrogenase [Deinococcus peraridilitoris]AFZ69681.1 dihydrolipoamide dehydrogenase [Deinococcus peraridilitoris DSM 19664]
MTDKTNDMTQAQPDVNRNESTRDQATFEAVARPGDPTGETDPQAQSSQAAGTGPHYDAIVLGGGMAGVPLAHRFAYKGLRVALIERAELGGTCLNWGCIPTKAMIASARVAHQAYLSEQWGVETSDVRVNLSRVVDRKNQLVESIRSGSERNVEQNENVTLIRGEARFTGERTLEVNGETVSADKIFIAVGTRNNVPPIEGLEQLPFLDSTTAMELREIPPHLVIVGGGYIGVEFAQMYRRFGSRVTVLQSASHLLPNEDEDIAEVLQEALEAEGIEVIVNARVTRVSGNEGSVRATATVSGGECTYQGTHLMIATGRVPNTDGLGLEHTGVDLDGRGFIKVNDRLETSAPGLWALGDVRGGPMFTHTARDDSRIIYQNVIKHADLSIKDRVVPWGVFTDPQLGRVGLSEREARQAGFKLKIGKYEARKVAKARAIGETRGLIKVVADAETDRILGASVLIADGAELVHEFVTAMQLGAKYTDLQDMIHIHPTLAEGLNNALGGVHYEEGLE